MLSFSGASEFGQMAGLKVFENNLKQRHQARSLGARVVLGEGKAL